MWTLMSVNVYGLVRLLLKLLCYSLQNVLDSVPLFSLRELSLKLSFNNVCLTDHVYRAVLGYTLTLMNCLLKLHVHEVALQYCLYIKT